MYILLWLSFIIISIVFLWLAEKMPSKVICVMYLIILIIGSLLLAFRPETVPDYSAYRNAFRIVDAEHIQGFSILSKEPHISMEYGFVYFMIAFKRIVSCDFRLFLFFIAIISICISTISLCGTVKHLQKDDEIIESEKYYYEILLIVEILYFSYMSLLYQGIAIRAAMAMSLSLLAVNRLEKNQYIRSVIDIVIAFMFHRMAVLAIPVLIVYKFFPETRHKKNVLLVAAAASFTISILIVTGNYSTIIGFLISHASGPLGILGYANYVSAGAGDGRIGIRLLAIAIVCVIYSYSDKTLFKLENVFLVGVLIATVFSGIGGAERIYDYFIVFFIPILALEYTNLDLKGGLLLPIIAIVAMNYYVGFNVWGII